MAATRKGIPSEFTALLSTRGRKFLRAPRAPRGPLVSVDGLLDAATLTRVLGELERHAASLELRETPLPPADSATESFADRLPVVERRSALSAERVPAVAALLGGAAFHEFAEALAGTPLGGAPALEIFAFARDGYTGPQLGAGAVRIELTLARPGAHQLLVHEADGHFSDTAQVARHGTVVALRLPQWHFTTPLQTRSAKDRRWVLRATFEERTT